MTSTASPSQGSRLRSVLAGTMAGSAIEWYDFYVFGTAAALALNKVFFSAAPPAIGTLLSFGTFATAWFARPLGGLIFSHLGDRIGRKRVLLITLVAMGTATTLIGVLPTYSTAGIFSPILLVLVRIIQGLAAGGEWGSATASAVENAPEGRRGMFGAFPQMGVPIGLLLSSVVSLIFYSLPNSELFSWGWRVPFLVTAVFVVIGQFMRRKLPESEEFNEATERGEIARFPLGDALRNYWRGILVVLLGQAIINVGFYTTTTYMLTYVTTDHWFSRSTALAVVALAALIDIGTVFASGLLSDKFGANRVFVAGTSAAIVAFAAVFPLVDTHSLAGLVVGVALIWPVIHGLAHGSQPSFFADLFPTRVRLTGMSVGYQFNGTAFSGPMPIIAGLLVSAASGSPWFLVAYIAGVGMISTIAGLLGPWAKRTDGQHAALHPAPADAGVGAG